MRLSGWALPIVFLTGCASVVPVQAPDVERTPVEMEGQSRSLQDSLSLNSASESPVVDEYAARALVSSYLTATDAIGSRGGHDPREINEVVTQTWLSRELEGFQDYVEQSIRTVGLSRFDHFMVQSARIDAAGRLEVAVFVCVDSRKVLVLGMDDEDPPESLREWLFAPPGAEQPEQSTVDSWAPYLDATGARTGFREPIVIWMVGETARELRVDGTENWRGAHPC
jgi:hypothetical protein